jgi:hypothetical protein
MTVITKKYKISGPNNIVRLTNGDKIIYLLGDYHYDLDKEYECEVDSKHERLDIDKFLIKFFNKEKNKNFDFFKDEKKDLAREQAIFDIENSIIDKKEIHNESQNEIIDRRRRKRK